MFNKRLYALTLFFIVVFAVIFRFVYADAEVGVTHVMTVISLAALLTSLGINFMIQQLQQKRGASDENKKS